MRYLIPGLALLSMACGSPATSSSNEHDTTSGGVGGSDATGATGGSGVNGGATGGSSSRDGGGSGGEPQGDDVTVPPVHIGACDDLPAPGTWQKINPPDANPTSTFADGLTGDIRTDPIDSGTVYVQVKGFGVYKSTDCGATWVKLNTGRNADMVRRGTAISLQIDPIDHDVMYVNSLYGDGGVWKSTNGGTDWDQMLDEATMTALHGGFISFVMIDPEPQFHEHLLASPHDGCYQAPWPGCLAESYDAGATWNLIEAPVSGETVGPIFVGGQTFLFTSGGLALTENGGDTWTHVSDGVSYGAGSNLYRASDGKYYSPSQHGAFTSSDLLTWTEIPFGRSLGFAAGDGKMYASDPWSVTYYVASESDPTNWAKLPVPAELDPAQGYGGVFLRYDPGHHILYSSNFAGGVFRLVVE